MITDTALLMKRTHMKKHRRCNKQVRDRVSADPSLIEYSNSVRDAINLAFGGLTNARIFSIRPLANFPLTCVCCSSAMLHVMGERGTLT